MERSEPSLAPEWLRSTGSGTGGGSSTHHFASSHSDRSLSSNSRRSSSSNGSTKHDKSPYPRSYSSFTRNHRDREKDRLTVSDHWDAEYSDPLRSILSGRTDKDTLRRSQSMVPRVPDEVLQRRASTDLRGSFHSNGDNGDAGAPVSGIATGIQKVTFERDFPSLGSDDRPLTPELSRVPSPGLSRAVQSVSTLISGEGWTSALAEVPIGVGSSVGSSSAVQPTAAPSSSCPSSTSSGLNMAEALVQAPLRSQTAPQPPVQTQRLEELAVLQSKRLIPMTPSMPKSSVLNPSDKLKPKTAPRSAEPVVGSKNGQLVSLQLNNQSPRGGNVRADAPKTSHTGKLFVLKPGRENGFPAAAKDATSPTTNVNNRLASVQSVGAPASTMLPLKHPNNPKHVAVERKAQVQSRTDFFNSVRKKAMNSTSVGVESAPVGSSVSPVEKSDKEHKNVVSGPVSSCTKNGSEVKCNGDAHMTTHSFLPSTDEEEEAAFMRSLGWEPNAGDDEGLTEEEINAFYQEYMKLRPASKLTKGLHSKLFTQSEPDAISDEAASELSPTDSMK